MLAGRYLLGQTIGEGAMGTVLRAVDELLGRPVAVKLLRAPYAQDPALVERFYGEARAAASIVDPHVVAVHDVVDDGGEHAIVMEHVDGPSLAAVLRRTGRLDEPRAVRYARDVASGLAAAHARGLLHRDIKPANLLLTPDDTIKVTDFGIAKVMTSDVALTLPGRLIGSAAYVSPEQAQERALSAASDLYSLGVVLHELVTGTLPFGATSSVQMAVAHVTEPAPSAAALARVMSPGLAAIVHRLLRKDPAERYATAGELIAALDALPAPGIAAPPPAVARTRARARTLGAVFNPYGNPIERGPALLTGAAVLLLLGVLGIGLSAHPEPPVTLADLRHTTVAHARSTLASAGLGAAVASRPDTRAQTGTVVAQSPQPGSSVARGTVVHLVASSGPPLVTVPNLAGMQLGQAMLAIKRVAVHTTVAARLSSAQANTVIAQYPSAGTQVRAGSDELVVISTGPQPPIIDAPAQPPPAAPVDQAPPGWRHHRHHGHGHGHGGDGGD